MLNLYNNKYSRQILKEHIYALKFIDILKTQTLEITFIVRYILNDLYQLDEEDKSIDINLVLKYQSHIQREELINALEYYDSDEDSVEDFQSFSERQSK